MNVQRFSIYVPMAWLVVFFLTPFILVSIISLADPAPAQPPYTAVFSLDGGLPAFHGDLEKYDYLLHQALYIKAFKGSMRIAIVTTLLCLLVAYPMAYVIARADEKTRPLLLMGVVLPFWTSFLIRIYAWIGLLSDNGILSKTLNWLGIWNGPIHVMRTDSAVFIGVVYAYLPFMILPLFSTLERMDWRLLDAAADLGARPIEAFFKVTLPLSLPGIFAGCLLVFIPVTGEFVIPALLGGPDTLMIGKVLWEEFFTRRDWPAASALAVLLVLVLLPAIFGLQAAQRAADGDA